MPTKKRTVFFVSNLFPPLQSPASIRMSKFVKYLTRLGWRCVVITSDVGPIRDIFYDEQLINEVPSGVKIIKTRSFIPNKSTTVKRAYDKSHLKLLTIAKEIMYTFIFPDPYLLWSLSATIAAGKLVKNDDVVITTLSPYSTAFVGLFLKMMFKIKWVMDYRDGWTTDPFYRFVKIRKMLESFLESCCLKLADAVTCVSGPLRNDLKNKFKMDDKIYVIENGLDTEDYVFENMPNLLDVHLFNFVYTGSISEKRRNIESLILAVDIIINKYHVRDIRLYFIGPQYDAVGGNSSKYEQMVTEFGLEKYIIFIPPVSRRYSLMYQQQANCLMLIYTSKNNLESVMSTKVFEYIYAKKAILGLINKSAVRELIEEYHLGICADPANKFDIADAMLNIYKDSSIYPDKTYFSELTLKYDRKNLALKLSKLLERI
jgi:glycosyltransferase involved in cell wall biosynthesis